MSAVEWLVELTVAVGKAPEARALLDEMANANASEPGTETWCWFLTEDESRVAILERFTDEVAAKQHLVNFGAFVPRFLALLTPVAFRVLAAPSQELRDAVAGFGPIFFASGGGFRR